MKRRLAASVTLAFSGLALAASGLQGPQTDTHVHVTSAGDTLIGLARRYLEDPADWREVARLNGVERPQRMPVGLPLHIPLRMMRSTPAPAELLTVVGPVRGVDGSPLRPGQSLPAGTDLATLADGGATLRLVDGTVLRLRGGSRLQVTESRRLEGSGSARATVRLHEGRVEAKTRSEAGGRPGFRIETPQGVLGVRGTEFRVGVDAQTQVTRTEVMQGRVVAAGRGSSELLEVAAGQGAAIDAGGRLGSAVTLPAPPDLQALPALHEETLVRLSMPALRAGERWRLQMADGSDFDRLRLDFVAGGPVLRVDGLPDGEYRVRLRVITADGFEGLDSDYRFRLKARPEPPLPQGPAPRSELRGSGVELAWTNQPHALEYRVQLAGAAGFERPLVDRWVRDSTRVAIEALEPGDYRWRVASVAADRDQGPFGVTTAFTLKPPPPHPPVPEPARISGDTADLSWSGAAGQQFDVQLARDAAFSTVLLERRVTQPAVKLPLPGSGKYHVRLRAIDPDGYVGPFSAPQHFESPHCARATAGNCVDVAGQPLLILP